MVERRCSTCRWMWNLIGKNKAGELCSSCDGNNSNWEAKEVIEKCV